jgi:hypothetical protein
MLFAHFRLSSQNTELCLTQQLPVNSRYCIAPFPGSCSQKPFLVLPPAVCCSRGFSVLFDYILSLRFRILEDYTAWKSRNVPAVSSFICYVGSIGDYYRTCIYRMAIPVQLDSLKLTYSRSSLTPATLTMTQPIGRAGSYLKFPARVIKITFLP